MEATEDSKVEGNTAFAAPPAQSYRYAISLAKGKISVVMEDSSSQKQWYTGQLEKEDVLTNANMVSGASLSDYVECFKRTLDAPFADSGDAHRKLTLLDDGSLRLELTVKIRVFQSAWSAIYAFLLHPVSVERIDEVEGKVRQVQSELERAWLQKHQDVRHIPALLQVEAGRKYDDDTLCWDTELPGDFTVHGCGAVRFLVPGVYSIGVVVNHIAQSNDLWLRLLKGRVCVQYAYCSYADGHKGSTSLLCAVRVEKDEEIVVTCRANLVGTSFLTAVQIGK